MRAAGAAARGRASAVHRGLRGLLSLRRAERHGREGLDELHHPRPRQRPLRAAQGLHVGRRRPAQEEVRRRRADAHAQGPVLQHAQDGRAAPAGDRQGPPGDGAGRRETPRQAHPRRYGRRTPLVHGAALPEPLYRRHELPRQIRVLLAHDHAQGRAGDSEPRAALCRGARTKPIRRRAAHSLRRRMHKHHTTWTTTDF